MKIVLITLMLFIDTASYKQSLNDKIVIESFKENKIKFGKSKEILLEYENKIEGSEIIMMRKGNLFRPIKVEVYEEEAKSKVIGSFYLNDEVIKLSIENYTYKNQKYYLCLISEDPFQSEFNTIITVYSEMDQLELKNAENFAVRIFNKNKEFKVIFNIPQEQKGIFYIKQSKGKFIEKISLTEKDGETKDYESDKEEINLTGSNSYTLILKGNEISQETQEMEIYVSLDIFKREGIELKDGQTKEMNILIPNSGKTNLFYVNLNEYSLNEEGYISLIYSDGVIAKEIKNKNNIKGGIFKVTNEQLNSDEQIKGLINTKINQLFLSKNNIETFLFFKKNIDNAENYNIIFAFTITFTSEKNKGEPLMIKLTQKKIGEIKKEIQNLEIPKENTHFYTIYKINQIKKEDDGLFIYSNYVFHVYKTKYDIDKTSYDINTLDINLYYVDSSEQRYLFIPPNEFGKSIFIYIGILKGEYYFLNKNYISRSLSGIEFTEPNQYVHYIANYHKRSASYIFIDPLIKNNDCEFDLTENLFVPDPKNQNIPKFNKLIDKYTITKSSSHFLRIKCSKGNFINIYQYQPYYTQPGIQLETNKNTPLFISKDADIELSFGKNTKDFSLEIKNIGKGNLQIYIDGEEETLSNNEIHRKYTNSQQLLKLRIKGIEESIITVKITDNSSNKYYYINNTNTEGKTTEKKIFVELPKTNIYKFNFSISDVSSYKYYITEKDIDYALLPSKVGYEAFKHHIVQGNTFVFKSDFLNEETKTFYLVLEITDKEDKSRTYKLTQERRDGKESSEESTEEKSQESKEESTEEKSQEKSQESSHEKSQESSHEKSQESSNEKSQESSHEKSQEPVKKESEEDNKYLVVFILAGIFVLLIIVILLILVVKKIKKRNIEEEVNATSFKRANEISPENRQEDEGLLGFE